MAEQEEKPIAVKGVDTGKDSKEYGTTIPKGKSSDIYKEPVKNQEFAANLAGIATEGSRSTVTGTDFFVNPIANKIYANVDLAKGIPDPVERERFLAYNSGKMVQLMDKDKYGIRFDREIQDHAIYKEKLYDKNVKKFLDDLDENQGWLEAAGVTAAKLVSKTALAVGSILPTIYGVGSALFNWDKSKLFNNTAFDAWETMDQALDKHLAVYGGSGYTEGDKNIFARFMNNPMKAINNDIVPAVAFIAGAIGTELLAVPLGAVTGGTALVANTARLAGQTTNFFAKGVKVLRGLDQVKDLKNMEQIASISQKYRTALATSTGMVRSAGYESALIARDTYEQTYNEFLQKHEEANGKPPSEAEKVRYKQLAEDAGEQAWTVNIPLVGFSNMMQFPKIFAGGYKIEKTLARMSPIKSTGTVIKDGVHVAKADVMSKWSRTGILGANMLKSGVTEGFEEYAQGFLQEGLTDYYTANYTVGSVEQSVSYLGAMTKAARNYAGSTEGQDSMTIGFLMGMLGVRLPIKTNAETSKISLSLKGTGYGGARETYKETKKSWEQDRTNAKHANENTTVDALKVNFENMAKGFTIQEEMDEALVKGDIFTYKNKEHESFHSFVETRRKLGIEDTIFQDLDALQELPLDKFNEQFATKGLKEFTEESRTEVLTKARKGTESILKASKEVETVFNDQEHLVDFWRKDFKALQDSAQVTGGIKEQMIYLHSANTNLAERESILEKEIQAYTGGKVGLSIAGRVTDVTKEGKVNVATTTKEAYQAILNEWQNTDPDGYNMNVTRVKPLLQDYFLIKDRKAKVSAMYKGLFTKSGATKFAKFYDQLEENRNKQIQEFLVNQQEKEAKEAKSEEKLRNVKADAKSTTGTTDPVDEREQAEANASDEAMKNLLKQSEVGKAAKTIDPSLIIKELEKNPSLFNILRDSLFEKGFHIGSNIEELKEILVENPDLIGVVQDEFGNLLIKNEEGQSTKVVRQEFADPENTEQKEPVEEDGDSDNFFAKASKAIESRYQPTKNVTNLSIIPVLHDKQIKGGVPVRNTDGSFKNWEGSDQPVDVALINSPDFLPNSKLENETVLATFKISDNEYNRTKNPSVEDIAIDVYHNDVFIGRLPAYKSDMPSNFLALRQTIVASKITEEQKNANIQEKRNKIISELEILESTYKQEQQEIEDKFSKQGVMKTMFGNPAAKVNEEHDLELEYEEAKKKLTDELSTLEEPIQDKKELINKNFDTIIEQLVKAKVNVFFNDKQEFKKCD